MLIPVHTTEIKFRAPERLVADVRARSVREGMTLSEFVRQALRRELRDAV